jgi:hypothetical protein
MCRAISASYLLAWIPQPQETWRSAMIHRSAFESLHVEGHLKQETATRQITLWVFPVLCGCRLREVGAPPSLG